MSAETIFVSYSSKDRPFALGLVKELKKLGANVWIDQLGIGLGENWDNAIEEALERSETFILILSPTSVESENVKDEVTTAIDTNKKMVPILIKECKLPMRWQRRQYADLANDPDKAINDILTFLGLQEKASDSLKKVLNLIGISEAPQKFVQKEKDNSTGNEVEKEIALEDLLVSDAEINRAIKMHNKGIKKNWQTTIIIAVTTVVLSIIVFLFKDSDFMLMLINNTIYAIIGLLLINLLSIRLYGKIKNHIRNIDLIELFKLKRERLTRVLNKLSNTEIDNFNNEFYNNITI